MTRVYLVDHISEKEFESVVLPGVPRVDDIVFYNGVETRVGLVRWHAAAGTVQVFVTPLEERFRNKTWWQ